MIKPDGNERPKQRAKIVPQGNEDSSEQRLLKIVLNVHQLISAYWNVLRLLWGQQTSKQIFDQPSCKPDQLKQEDTTKHQARERWEELTLNFS